MSSPTSTAGATASDAPVAPSSPPLDAAPPLTTTILTTHDDKAAALKLIADSIAQQRQTASKALILSPAFFAVWILAIAVLARLVYHEPADVGILLTTGAGATMAMFLACRMATAGYIGAAEAVNWGFLQNPDGEEDVVIGTRFGDEVIGALVLRVEGANRGRKAARQTGNAIIRAWTVRLRFRNKGVGRGLLEEAVRVARERGGKDVLVGFADDHANSKRVLWDMFNGVFRKQQERAVKMLEDVGKEFGAEKRKK
jgi:GNAT superfamily N-acetyltransferase